MTALSIQAPFPIITDIDGQPLEDGFIWIGVANLPPIGNPITVYWDAALTQPAALPVRTLGGYPMNSGTPGRLYAATDYSILVQNKNGSTVYSSTDNNGPLFGGTISSVDVTFLQAGANAVERTVQAKLRETVSVLDFGADPTGATDSSAAFLAAMTAAFNVYVPEGTYKVDASNSGGCLITSGSGYHLFGEGEKSIIRRGSYNPAKANINFDSGSASSFIDDVKFSNLKFVGDVATLGHDEIYGLMLNLSGVRRVVIEKCYFEGPRSDAISFSSGPGGPTSERHNFDVVIRDCVFNGVVYGADGGRNAISVIDVDGMIIEGNSFRDWSRNDMPGSIDFEPNFSFGVIKNVRVVNNKFTNTAGTAGHVVFACDNIPTANQQNWVITGNEFSGATGAAGAAVYLLTEKTTPSVPSTNGQNIIIANNTATNCKWFVDKFKGSVNGITIANNVVNFAGSTQGAVRFADGTANYTLTDAVITGNSFITTNNIPVTIGDNIVNLTFSNNIMRGATQAHLRFGQTGSSTTSIVVTDNQFLGTPSNFLCQHDADTHNPVTNVWRNNRAPSTVSNNFRAYAVDVTGNNLNIFTTATLPSDFPYGESVAYANGVNVGVATLEGIVKTYKHSALNNTNIYQKFYPLYDATNDGTTYIRKAVNASSWGGWARYDGLNDPVEILGQLTVSRSSDDQIVAARPGLGALGYPPAGVGSLRCFDTDNNVSVAKFQGVSDGGTSGAISLQTLISGSVNTRLQIGFTGNTIPGLNNTYKLGEASYLWSEVFAATPTINTSDEREKQDIATLDAAEIRVAAAIKGLVRKFRFKDAVEKKGNDARIHIGVVAQEVIAAFQAEGLDPMRYGFICYDEWDSIEEVVDGSGNVISHARPAGNRYGVRYEELLAFVIAAL